AAAQTARPLRGVLIAAGTPAQPGADARLELTFKPLKVAGTLIEGTTRIDYRERGTLRNVSAGDLLATKIAATPGVDGSDVFGSCLPATPGKDRELTPVAGVCVSDDGLRYTAEVDGVVSLAGGDKLGVYREYDVSGDVDYSTGNLMMDGTLVIEGWVRAGFRVRATGDISVGAGIEDAAVEAGGNLVVGGGIVGKGGCEIQVGGHVHARFIENALVNAEGDLAVDDSVVRSVIRAGGHVSAVDGKGRVVGGAVTAGTRVEVQELGAESGVQTEVDVGTDAKTRELLALCEQRLAVGPRDKAKARMAAARIAQKAKGGTLGADEKRTFDKLVKFRRAAAQREATLTKCRQALARKAAENEDEPVRVTVSKAVYEGTTVVLRGFRHVVRETSRGGGAFVLNMEEWGVEYVPNG
ncbi:MAG: DUF342 domain-containing protein, partial [Candidatus Hydrogenedentes bacterium]|nr:DUF342 domain-containing protein [Candidatus Hydrogenedentota bacterium]